MIVALAGKAAEGGWRGPLIALGVGIAIVIALEIAAKNRRGK